MSLLTELESIFDFPTTKMSPRWGFHAPGGGRISSSNFSPAPAGHLACAGGWQLAICDS